MKGAQKDPGSAAFGCGTQRTHLLILGLFFSPVKWSVGAAHSPKSLPDLKFLSSLPPEERNLHIPRKVYVRPLSRTSEPSPSVTSDSTIHFHGQQK